MPPAPQSNSISPQGVAVDGNGNVYVADTMNFVIRKITSGGVSSTLAGLAGTFGTLDGMGSAARFNCPVGLAVDGSGNLYVTDYNNDTIREVSPAGVVTTIAGWPGIWGSTDGTGSAALFFQPTGITIDGSGNLYVVDSGNGAIRKLTVSGTNWTSTTVAGTAGVIGIKNGSGGAAQFNFPVGAAFNGAGYIFVADAYNNVIRTTKSIAGITWGTPSSITYGTGLGGAQLNATTGVSAHSPIRRRQAQS